LYGKFATDQSKKNWIAQPLKMGPLGCPKILVTNYQSIMLKYQNSIDLIYTVAQA